MHSLRNRLMLATAAATTIVLVAAAVSLYVLVRAALVQQFDQGLLAQARAIAGMTEMKHDAVTLEVDPGELPEFQLQAHRPQYFELSEERGKVIARSPTLGERRTIGTLWSNDPSEPVAVFIVLPDGRAGRGLWMRFTPRS